MFSGVGYQEMMLVGIVALVLYGKNLPDVAKKFGKTYSEFKRGMQGLQREFHSALGDNPLAPTSSSSSSPPKPAARRPEPVTERTEEFRAPRFQPPVAPPTRKTGSLN